MILNKIKIDKNFIIKNKVVLMCILCTIFALLTPLCTVFRYFHYACILAMSILFPFQEAFCAYGFMWFFTGLTCSKLGAWFIYSFFLVGSTIRYIIDLKQGRAKFAKGPFFASLIFYLFSLMPLWNYAHIFGLGITLLFLIPIYLIYVYRDSLDAVEIVKYMFWGLVTSVVIGYLLGGICKIGAYSIINFAGERKQFFTDNPNYLSVACIVVTAGIILGTLKHRFNWWTGVLYSSIVVFMGSQTRSKAFMLSLFLLILITIFILLFKNKKVAFITIGSLVAVGVLLFFCFRSYFEYMIGRFLYSGAISIESVTTDRWNLWMHFLSKQFESPVNVIFGMGAWSEVFSVPGDTTGSFHSIYIEFFYHYGVIGLVLLAVLIWSFTENTKKEIGKNKLFVKFEDIVPFLMIMVMGIVEMIIFSQKSVFLPLSIIFIFNGSRHIPVGSEKLTRMGHIKELKQIKKDETKNEFKR